MERTILAAWLCAATFTAAGATGIPTADKPGSQDNPILKRYEGSLIIAYEYQSFGDFTLPLSPLSLAPGKMDAHNNHAFEPKQKRALEGPHTRLVYLLPANRTPLEAVRNYQQEIRGKGGKILFACNGIACGGDAARASSGGGGEMSVGV
jgi:OmpA-OmpF porin, OOP family